MENYPEINIIPNYLYLRFQNILKTREQTIYICQW